MRQKPSYTDTKFHHFPGVGTIAMFTGGTDPEHVSVGLALLALPRYLDCRRNRVDPLELQTFWEDEALSYAEPGDQFSRAKGRLISHGRAVTQRGYASVMLQTTAHTALINLRQAEATLHMPGKVHLHVNTGNGACHDAFDERFVRAVQERARLQVEMLYAYCPKALVIDPPQIVSALLTATTALSNLPST